MGDTAGKSTPENDARAGEARRVLVIEDDGDIASSIALILTHPLVEVEVATNGVAGTARARALQPDAIVLDIELPAMDGFEVFHTIRRETDLVGTKVIFASGRAQRGAFVLLRELGAFACLTKPFDPETLRKTVMDALGIKDDGPVEPPIATGKSTVAVSRRRRVSTSEETKNRRKGRAKAAAPSEDDGEPEVPPTEPPPLRRRPSGKEKPAPRPAPIVLLFDGDADAYGVVSTVVREAIGEDALVSHVRSGAAGLRALTIRRPDVVLIDLRLPDMDGANVLRFMRRAPKLCDVPAIVLTANADWSKLAVAFEAGADAYVPKPVEAGLLASLLKQMYHSFGDEHGISDIAAQELRPGTVLAGRYDVRSLLGVGGMGAVYRVRDRLRKTDVALKVMLPSLLAREKAVERFKREAEIMLRLSHPRVVRVFDVGQDRDRWLRFFTMELLGGRSLRDWLDDKKKRSEEARPEEVLEIALQVLEALEYAHKTTVHRDLKPENVFVLAGDRLEVKLLDFGIAKARGGGRFTSTEMAMGTAIYMAPEQQEDAAGVDGRADLYSVAVMLYEMLLGKLPRGRFPTPTEVRKSVPRELSDLILRALAVEPEDRPQTAAAFLREPARGAPRARAAGDHVARLHGRDGARREVDPANPADSVLAHGDRIGGPLVAIALGALAFAGAALLLREVRGRL